MVKQNVNICWFRRDLRLHDNAALYHALKEGLPVVPLFIFDQNILLKLDDKGDRRVEFIHQAVSSMQNQLLQMGSSMEVHYGEPVEVMRQLLLKYKIEKLFTNYDYEPYAAERDTQVLQLLNDAGTSFHTFKDQVIFDKEEILKDDGKPYTVFTPYSRKWKAKLNEFYLECYPTEKYFNHFYQQPAQPIPSLQQMGFQQTGSAFPSSQVSDEIIVKYKEQRDIPSLQGTSRLSVHLRFGTISIRELARHVKDMNESFLNELIWRDFYHMILWHFPHVGKDKAFKKEYDLIEWRNNEDEFHKWCNGQTGYPIVDAGMRELNETGFMHNRVRMIVASFLTKHLLIDWRWGEAYFAKKLLDFDLAANNGGWQWAAGSGCDAAPYFRIFNPYLQTQKFDPQLKYIRKWVPEFEGFEYVKPVVVHEVARKRCLEVYAKALKK
ncbi:MAG: DNA photolyase family protein [Chitinophagaceae bacterium]|jgi:deoxyribodipyrimidine photo-lyase|nr:DNA photolyase family protein [Chitinophagaceae bacterium]